MSRRSLRGLIPPPKPPVEGSRRDFGILLRRREDSRHATQPISFLATITSLHLWLSATVLDINVMIVCRHPRGGRPRRISQALRPDRALCARQRSGARVSRCTRKRELRLLRASAQHVARLARLSQPAAAHVRRQGARAREQVRLSARSSACPALGSDAVPAQRSHRPPHAFAGARLQESRDDTTRACTSTRTRLPWSGAAKTCSACPHASPCPTTGPFST